jgi:hypothetical protein
MAVPTVTRQYLEALVCFFVWVFWLLTASRTVKPNLSSFRHSQKSLKDQRLSLELHKSSRLPIDSICVTLLVTSSDLHS